jgi:hypothetical protein
MTATQMLTVALKDANAELAGKKSLTPEQEAKRQARRQRKAQVRRQLVGNVMAWLAQKSA